MRREGMNKERLIVEVDREAQVNERVALEPGDQIQIIRESEPLLGSREGKKVIEVRTYGSHADLLFEDNVTLRVYDFSWKGYR